MRTRAAHSDDAMVSSSANQGDPAKKSAMEKNGNRNPDTFRRSSSMNVILGNALAFSQNYPMQRLNGKHRDYGTGWAT